MRMGVGCGVPVGVKAGTGVRVGVGNGAGDSRSDTINATKTEYVMKANAPTRVHCQRAMRSSPLPGEGIMGLYRFLRGAFLQDLFATGHF